MEISALSVHAECKDNTQCIFENQSMPVKLTIKNISTRPIGVPVEFLNQKGPHCVLIDTETKEELQVSPPPPPDLSLKNKFTEVAPGDSITIEHLVSRSAIIAFRERMIDLTAKFVIIMPVKFDQTEAPLRQIVSTTLRIRGRDKVDLDNK
ncbi:hypothetical protein SAMN05428966_105145 [Massilia sp. PDC64]|nr:hypothetical protein SAMN05428966_105145 [Massilia sp. PDC64]